MIEILSRKIKTLSIKSFISAIKIIYGWKEKLQGTGYEVQDHAIIALSLSFNLQL